jgi:hypothetical protein
MRGSSQRYGAASGETRRAAALAQFMATRKTRVCHELNLRLENIETGTGHK